jgi:anti-sigma regulatory factor (Ser/Thr protein kinase)
MVTAMQRTYFATLKHLREMLDFIREEARRSGADIASLGKIELASEEALVNIVNYSYPAHEGEINIACHARKPREFQVEIRDKGIAYNPLACLRGVPTQAPSLEPSLGGYGIFLMLHLMDEVNYIRESQGNTLTLTKYF